MSEGEDGPPVVQRDPRLCRTVAWSIAVGATIVGLTSISLNNRAARAAALTAETRAASTRGAEEGGFDGQSMQEANKSRRPEQLHRLCYCVAEKLSYTMTMEKAIAAASKQFSPTAEEERVMRAVFDNCWQVNMK